MKFQFSRKSKSKLFQFWRFYVYGGKCRLLDSFLFVHLMPLKVLSGLKSIIDVKANKLFAKFINAVRAKHFGEI